MRARSGCAREEVALGRVRFMSVSDMRWDETVASSYACAHTQDAGGLSVLPEKVDATAFASAAFSCFFFNSAAARFSGQTLAFDLARAARGGDAGADITKALRAPKRPPQRPDSKYKTSIYPKNCEKYLATRHDDTTQIRDHSFPVEARTPNTTTKSPPD